MTADKTEKTEQLFDQLAEELAGRDVRAGAMFGKRSLLAGRQAFVCLYGDGLAFRLGAGTPAHNEALALPGAELFDPSGKQRPFKDWVTVPAAEHAHWRRLAEAALTARS